MYYVSERYMYAFYILLEDPERWMLCTYRPQFNVISRHNHNPPIVVCMFPRPTATTLSKKHSS